MTDLDLDTFAADGTRICSIADALELIGDRWSLLVVREIGFEVHRFDQIRTRTGAPRQMLAARLRKLEEVGVVERRKYQDRPERYEYVLTEAGRALFPVLVDLRKWGERFAPSRPVRRPDGDLAGGGTGGATGGVTDPLG
ncbi:winged helix-turn-helix transcriptional regulator [Streptomyces solisilvae]|uniref:winged helix-turn-helix transcriptional regulator n=1 Tax=Streptomyces malaysiensis TaxID=92644 RepID=UPI0020443D46|nr:helix-turn-helix domain-containing protein [Streptomyces sp. DR7-3]MCM3811399.1 helix-turn-helix transcriptional regulator [Streptomyces sp. DR7-3]